MLLRVFLTVLLATALLAAERNPSTPEDRAKLVDIANSLAADPFTKGAKDQRNWAVMWLIQVPDVNVKICAGLLGRIGGSKNFAGELTAQLLLSSAAYVIQHPDRANDNIAVYTAGVEGVLKAYQAILKSKPKATWPSLDELIAKRDRGELPAAVAEAVSKHCGG